MTQQERTTLNRLQQRIASKARHDDGQRPPGLFIRSVQVDPAHAGERFRRQPSLFSGPAALLVGEYGSSRTTLLETIVAQYGIQPGDGHSYTETENDRDATALSTAIDVMISQGLARWAPGYVQCGTTEPR